MRVWVVLLDPDGTGAERRASRLRGSFEGVVTVSGDEAGGRLAGLLAGLAEVPGDVAVVALVEAGADATVCERVAELAGRLRDGDASAVVRARPVVDALKRVEGDWVVGGVDRSGLCAPETPQLIRRSALREALDARGPGVAPPDDDPAVLLARRGLRVELVPS